MKTIEERAREFVEGAANGQDVPDYINELLVECYCIAAMEERKLLTEWHDPEKERPHLNSTVLVRYAPTDDTSVSLFRTTEYRVHAYIGPHFHIEFDSAFAAGVFKMTGWRYIH